MNIMMRSGRAGQSRGGVSALAHMVLAVLGVAFLVSAATPMHYDGLLPVELVPFLILLGLVVAAIPGVLGGLAVRAERRWLGAAVVYVFAPVLLYPLGVMSGHWFPDDGTVSSRNLAVTSTLWICVIAFEWAIARAIARRHRHGDLSEGAASDDRVG